MLCTCTRACRHRAGAQVCPVGLAPHTLPALHPCWAGVGQQLPLPPPCQSQLCSLAPTGARAGARPAAPRPGTGGRTHTKRGAGTRCLPSYRRAYFLVSSIHLISSSHTRALKRQKKGFRRPVHLERHVRTGFFGRGPLRHPVVGGRPPARQRVAAQDRLVMLRDVRASWPARIIVFGRISAPLSSCRGPTGCS